MYYPCEKLKYMFAFLTKFLTYGIIGNTNGGWGMIEKIIVDKDIIFKLTKKKDKHLIIQYNKRNRRAWFKTESMPKRKPIALSRVIEL